MRRGSRTTVRGAARAILPASPLTRLLLSPTSSTISGTRIMQTAQIGAETDVGGAIDGTAYPEKWMGGPGGGEDEFVSGPAPTGGVTIGGTAQFQVRAQITSGSGYAIQYRLYKRSTSGTLTLIGNYDSPALTTSAATYNWSGTIPSTSIAAGERLLVRVFAIMAAGGNVPAGAVSFWVGSTTSANQAYIDVPAATTIAFDPDTGGGSGSAPLWASGFENNVVLGTYNGSQAEPTGSITGTDLSTGHSWNSPPFGSTAQMFYQATEAPSTSYVEASIDTVTGRTGASTKALRTRIIQTTPSWTQMVCWLLPSQNINEVCIRAWYKYPANMASWIGNGGWILVGPEIKSTDFRVISNIEISSGQRYLHIKVDRDAGAIIHEQSNTATAAAIPDDGSWFQMHLYYKRAGAGQGRVQIKVNSTVVYDQTLNTIGLNNAYLNRVFLQNCYGSVAHQVYTDDIEIHSTLPT